MSKVVLGKGLGALIPGEAKKSDENKKYQVVALDNIAPNPMQPRRIFKEQALQELADSLKTNGLMQPLVVRQTGSSYTIIAGERRFRAARLAGLNEVPVVVVNEDNDDRLLELALIENIQREDLNPLEVAEAYRALIERCQLTQNELAVRVGKSRTAVTNLLRLLTLPESLQRLLREGKLTEGHARAILTLDNEAAQLRMADEIITGKLSVREAERRTGGTKKRKIKIKRGDPAVTEMENYLKRLFGTSVKNQSRG